MSNKKEYTFSGTNLVLGTGGVLAVGIVTGYYIGKKKSSRQDIRKKFGPFPCENEVKDEVKSVVEIPDSVPSPTPAPTPAAVTKPARKPRVKVTPEMVHEWKQLSEEGISRPEIALRFNVSKAAVDKYLRKKTYNKHRHGKAI